MVTEDYKIILKGLFRVFPPIKLSSIPWQLNLVLSALMKPPFEPIHKAELQFISWKVALLLALTSARRVSEIQVFSISETFLQFKADRVILRTNPKFIPKVPTMFHLNLPIVLPTYFRNPSSIAEKSLHTLDIRRCLKFYLDKTKSFRKSDQLLIAFAGLRKGLAMSRSSISRWIASAITLAHEKAGKPLRDKVQAHSTRKIAASTALFAGVSLPDICRAATWSNVHTFTRHYCLDTAWKADSSWTSCSSASIPLR